MEKRLTKFYQVVQWNYICDRALYFCLFVEKPKPCIKRKTAKPLHLLRVEKALDVNHFLHNLKVSAEDTSSDSGDDANNEELLGFKGIIHMFY